VNAVVTSFLSDGAEEVAEYTGTGGLLRRYVPGPGTDQPIAMITPAGAGQTRSYFHVNRQGSTVAMSNDAGTVSEGPYTYDAYGQGASSAGVPFKYTGRRLDPETGLYYYRARYYSASLGRFLQTDPIGYGDDMNMYAYVGGDPVNFNDPLGEAAYLVSRPLGTVPGNHMFVVVVDDKTGKVVKRYSYGPQGGFWDRGSLVSVSGDGRPVDIADDAAWERYSSDPVQAREEGVSAVKIEASDDAVIASGDAMDRQLGDWKSPGNVPYETIPNSQANSNAAAYGVAQKALDSEGGGRQNLPPGTRNPGWGQHKNIDRDGKPRKDEHDLCLVRPGAC
jgi:RHS repeat-associated protein